MYTIKQFKHGIICTRHLKQLVVLKELHSSLSFYTEAERLFTFSYFEDVELLYCELELVLETNVRCSQIQTWLVFTNPIRPGIYFLVTGLGGRGCDVVLWRG